MEGSDQSWPPLGVDGTLTAPGEHGQLGRPRTPQKDPLTGWVVGALTWAGGACDWENAWTRLEQMVHLKPCIEKMLNKHV